MLPTTIPLDDSSTVIPTEHYADFRRLVKNLRFEPPFQLLLIEFGDTRYRDYLIAELDEVLAKEGLASARMELTPSSHPDFAAVENDWARLAANHQALHVLGGEQWFNQERMESFNIRREAVARRVPLRLMLWLNVKQVNAMPDAAPDLWSWRNGVFSFIPQGEIPFEPQIGAIDPRNLEERLKRIDVLNDYLTSQPPLPDDFRLPLVDELARLLKSVGQLDGALKVLQEEQLQLCRQLGRKREIAITQGKIADIFQLRKQWDEALRIREQEELPVYRELKNPRLIALTLGQIADIRRELGQMDEALRIFKEEVLPDLRKLDMKRDIATTQGKIADILVSRGQLQEALTLREQEQLPVFAKLGDERSLAVAQGKIADILQGLGRTDEALRIREETVLPVYRRLGAAREAALTHWKIADLLQRGGDTERALSIYREEVIPTLLKLGDDNLAGQARERMEAVGVHGS